LLRTVILLERGGLSNINRDLDLDLTNWLMQDFDTPTFQVVCLWFPVVYLLDTCG
jgi:hypothetical protein